MINEIKRYYSSSVIESGYETRDHSSPWHCIVLGLLAALFLSRQPGALLSPTFIAEDGVIFFKQQYEYGLLKSLTTEYAGYYHTVPRLIAWFASLFDVSNAPLIYAIASWLIGIISYCYFTTSSCSIIMGWYPARVIITALMIISPDTDNAFKLNCIQWYLLLLMMWIVMVPLPTNAWRRGALLLALVATVWTSPVSLFFLPIDILRALSSYESSEKWIWTVVLINFVIMAATLKTGVVPRSGLDLGQLLSAATFAIAFRAIGDTFLGTHVNSLISNSAPAFHYGLSLLFGCLFLVSQIKGTFAQRWSMMVFLYASLFCIAGLAVRPWIADFINISGAHSVKLTLDHQRYFFIPVLFVLFVLFVSFNHLLMALNGVKKAQTGFVILVFSLGYFAIHHYDHILWDWRSQKPWREVAYAINQAENDTTVDSIYVDATSGPEWNFNLIINH